MNEVELDKHNLFHNTLMSEAMTAIIRGVPTIGDKFMGISTT